MHTMGQLDNRPDGVDTYAGDRHDLDSYSQGARMLSQLQSPILVHANNPHERLYVAALDGTSNCMFDDAPENWSAVARIYEQVRRSEEHTSELQSLMRISYAVFCLKKKKKTNTNQQNVQHQRQ